MRRLLVNTTIGLLLPLLCRLRAAGIDRVPARGPLIIAANHINFLDVPVLYLLLRPRRVIGVAKEETWDNPALRLLANTWGAIPIRRGTADARALRTAIAELRQGGIVGMAPEGTRSRDGKLKPASAGVVTLAAATGAPVLPLAHWGGESVWSELKRGRRTIVRVRVGRPIVIRRTGEKPWREQRREELERIMAEIARMLPPEYRGHYG